jgi:hypothetical protein
MRYKRINGDHDVNNLRVEYVYYSNELRFFFPLIFIHSRHVIVYYSVVLMASETLKSDRMHDAAGPRRR